MEQTETDDTPKEGDRVTARDIFGTLIEGVLTKLSTTSAEIEFTQDNELHKLYITKLSSIKKAPIQKDIESLFKLGHDVNPYDRILNIEEKEGVLIIMANHSELELKIAKLAAERLGLNLKILILSHNKTLREQLKEAISYDNIYVFDSLQEGAEQ
jgi:hypothetical protein